MRKFTLDELRLHNGVHRPTIYIAYRGKVYDVTTSFLWQKGVHQVTHNAGTDCTSDLKQAPHGADLLVRYPVVGILVDE